jgi:protein transport protein SEC31
MAKQSETRFQTSMEMDCNFVFTPELAHQYGNVGTSNPIRWRCKTRYCSKCGLVDPWLTGLRTLDMNLLEVQTWYWSKTHFSHSQLATDYKSNGAETAAYRQRNHCINQKLSRGGLGPELMSQVYLIVWCHRKQRHLGDHNADGSCQLGDWRNHKDWLKGIKLLIQLASKLQVTGTGREIFRSVCSKLYCSSSGAHLPFNFKSLLIH